MESVKIKQYIKEINETATGKLTKVMLSKLISGFKLLFIKNECKAAGLSWSKYIETNIIITRSTADIWINNWNKMDTYLSKGKNIIVFRESQVEQTNDYNFIKQEIGAARIEEIIQSAIVIRRNKIGPPNIKINEDVVGDVIEAIDNTYSDLDEYSDYCDKCEVLKEENKILKDKVIKIKVEFEMLKKLNKIKDEIIKKIKAVVI